MKWKLNRRTMQMEPQRKTGVEVTARMGGIMVEDHDKNIQFLINYGTSGITHCFGCRPENIHLFDDNKSRQIAERMKRIGAGKGLDESFFDYRRYSINNKDFGNANEGKYVKSFDEVLNEGNVKPIKGTKRLEFDDDVVIVYDGNGEIVYQGIDEFNPYKDEDWIWDEKIKGYRMGDYIQICVDTEDFMM